jgi:5-methylcytosine-specific restriction protein A
MADRARVYRGPTSKARAAGADRPTASGRGYDRRWRRARLAFLNANPTCVDCRSKELTVEATTVDHINPHRGDPDLFWDQANWQSLCTACHNRKTARGQ